MYRYFVMPRFLPELLRVIPLAEELNGPFRPKEPVTDRFASLTSIPCLLGPSIPCYLHNRSNTNQYRARYQIWIPGVKFEVADIETWAWFDTIRGKRPNIHALL